MSELIPCPFCGWEFAEHAWNEFGEEYRVCDQCGASSGTVDSKWDWQSRPIEDELRKRIAELEAENAELKERVAMLDVTAVFKSLGEMGYIEQTNRLHTRIAELESTIERLIEAGKRLLDSLCIDPEEEKTVEVMNWKAVVDKVNKERER